MAKQKIIIELEVGDYVRAYDDSKEEYFYGVINSMPFEAKMRIGVNNILTNETIYCLENHVKYVGDINNLDKTI